ncbi:MAG: DUF4832 domain-containing protein [Allomuricauda sp.]
MEHQLFLLLVTLFTCCNAGRTSTSISDTLDTVHIEYTVDESDFTNPDRGFYRPTRTTASNYTILNESELRAYREPTASSGANYTTKTTLVFRYFLLDEFTNSPISQEFLDNMQLDFDAVRNAGAKIIPRIAYTNTSNAGDCEEGFICPPYGDAPKEIVLGHIRQLSPVLTKNSDVITTLQLGFIGTWGENYYTDYFGDSSPNANQGKLLDKNWQDRIDVLKALLDATPKDLMVQVRYPQMKQRYVYGVKALTDVPPLKESEGFTGSDKARIGFHNDCLFASPDDYGTYTDYGNSSSIRKEDIPNLKSYFKDDSKYVIVGGETCADQYSPENNCSPEGTADIDLRSLHYTYLNASYNNEVNNDWTDGGCMETIKRNLGYRFVLENATLPNTIKAGDSFDIRINLKNVGYASPVKRRDVKLILRNKENGNIVAFEFDTDVRKWFSEVSLEQSFTAGQSLAPGEYEILFLLEEGYETLKGRPEYRVRFANKEVWEESTGYNSLQHSLRIE